MTSWRVARSLRRTKRELRALAASGDRRLLARWYSRTLGVPLPEAERALDRMGVEERQRLRAAFERWRQQQREEASEPA